MSRTRQASILLVFGYLQVAVSMLSGVVLLPMILQRVGNEAYGLWLAFGELLAYSALADFGLLDAFPWMLAEADGEKNRERMHELVSAAIALGLLMTALLAGLSLCVLAIAPHIIHVTAAQRSDVYIPLGILIVGSAIAYPLRLFVAVLYGLQDALVVGSLNLLATLLNASLIAGLLTMGWRLSALAIAATLPSVVVGTIAALRIWSLTPDLVRSWKRPQRSTLARLSTQGSGTWAASLGWRMIAATNSLVIVRLAGPTAAVIYACSAKLGEVLMQLTWQIPDAGLVGLAQLYGEKRIERVREVVTAMLRLMLIASGAASCFVLAFNRPVVLLWVGTSRYAGSWVTAALAAAILTLSVTHCLVASAATLGRREVIGAASITQGVIHLVVVVCLGRVMGLSGVALAAVVSSLVVTYPTAANVLKTQIGLRHSRLFRESISPWLVRMLLPIMFALLIARLAPTTKESSLLILGLAPLLGIVFAWSMRSLIRTLPWPARIYRLLRMVRLVPPRIDAAGPAAAIFPPLAGAVEP